MECGPCDGDLAYALDLVDVLAAQPPTTMKVQFYTAETIAARYSPRYDRTDDRPLSQRQLFADQLTWDQWAEVAEVATKKNVPFFPTVFSPQAVDKAVEMGIRTVKIASGDITNLPLIHHASQCDNLILSTGAATRPEIKRALDASSPANATVLACHLSYPTELQEANLLRVTAIKEAFPYPVGYSDHTRGIATVAPLVVLGATMWEKHFTIATRPEGDHAFAITPDKLATAHQVHKTTIKALGSTNLIPTPNELAARRGARRSLATLTDIPKGTVITRNNTTFLRPATGFSYEEAPLVYGAVATADIPEGTTITPDMVVSNLDR